MKEVLNSVENEFLDVSIDSFVFDDVLFEEISDMCIVESNIMKDKQELLCKSFSVIGIFIEFR